MDEETRAALADIMQGIANLRASVALVARHQNIQGERLDRILEILAPEEEELDEEKGPTTAELIGRMMSTNAKVAKDLAEKIEKVGAAVEGVAGQTVQAMGESYSLPPKQQP